MDIQGISCYQKGKGPISVVILTALGSVGAEWWHIVDRLSNKYNTMVYDRPGYGKSSTPRTARSSRNAAEELNALIERSGIPKPVILMGHSLGGLYAQEFAMRYPETTRGLVLLDPMTVENGDFRNILTEEEYRQSPIDKSAGIKIGKLLCSLGLGFLIRALSKNGIPFYYFNGFSKEARKIILDSRSKRMAYAVALDEYIESEKEENIRELKDFIFSGKRPDIPAALVLHDPDVMVRETMEFGGSSRETAEKIETAWSGYMNNTLKPYDKNQIFIADKGSHYMALTHPDLLDKAVDFILSVRRP